MQGPEANREHPEVTNNSINFSIIRGLLVPAHFKDKDKGTSEEEEDMDATTESAQDTQQ